MVFGWGKKKDVEPEAPQERAIGLGGIPAMLDELRRVRESQAVSEVRKLRDDSAPLVDELIKIGRLLEEDELITDEVDKHLGTIVRRGKSQVIDAIRRDVQPLPEVESFGDAARTSKQLGQTLKKLGDVLGRQTRVIHIFAKKYAVQLKGNLEELNSRHAEIKALLSNLDGQEVLRGQIMAAIAEYGDAAKSRQEKLRRIAELRESSASRDAQIAGARARIDSIKLTERYKERLEIEGMVAEHESRKGKMRRDALDRFSKISRPLGRYEYGSSLDKEQKAVLSQLVKDPFEALIPENESHILAILANVRKAISTGSISVKDTAKSLQLLDETVDSLGAHLAEVAGYWAKLGELRAKLRAADMADLDEAEADLAKSESDRDDIASRIASLESEAGEAESRMPGMLSRVQGMVRRYSNTAYVVRAED